MLLKEIMQVCNKYSEPCQTSKMEHFAKIVKLLYREPLEENLTFEYKVARIDFKYDVHIFLDLVNKKFYFTEYLCRENKPCLLILSVHST